MAALLGWAAAPPASLLGQAVGQASVAAAQPAPPAAGPTKPAAPDADAPEPDPAAVLGPLPARPRGKPTVMGGALAAIDPVRDQFTLRVTGGRRLTILFDERTQFFRDGVRKPLRELAAADHASVETVLDDTAVWAVSVHVLSRAPEGEVEGQVLSYNPVDGSLTVNDRLSHGPVTVRVPAGTPLTAPPQTTPAMAALTPGALVTVHFLSEGGGHGVASTVELQAAPGASFVFHGEVAALDLHAGLLALVDPQTGQRYSLSFDPARPGSFPTLREGQKARVSAVFDGQRYVATGLAEP